MFSPSWLAAGALLCLVMSGCLVKSRLGHQTKNLQTQSLERDIQSSSDLMWSSQGSPDGDFKVGDKVRVAKGDVAVGLTGKVVVGPDFNHVQLQEDFDKGERHPRRFKDDELKFQNPPKTKRDFKVGDAVEITKEDSEHKGRKGIIFGSNMFEVEVCKEITRSDGKKDTKITIDADSLEAAKDDKCEEFAAGEKSDKKDYKVGDKVKIIGLVGGAKACFGCTGKVQAVGISYVQLDNDFKRGSRIPRGYTPSELLHDPPREGPFKKGDRIVVNKGAGSRQKRKLGVVWAEGMIKVTTCRGYKRPSDGNLAQSVATSADTLAPAKEGDKCPGAHVTLRFSDSDHATTNDDGEEKSDAFSTLAFSSVMSLFWPLILSLV